MSERQLAMVMDLNKCIGCQTCTSACKTQWTNRNGREYMYWNNVETHPGQGYPRKWEEAGGGFDDAGRLKPGRIPDLQHDYGAAFDMNYLQALNPRGHDQPPSFDGERPHLAPVDAPVNGPNWDEDQGAGEYPNSYYFYLPRICNHCTNPACVAACPRKAIYKREETASCSSISRAAAATSTASRPVRTRRYISTRLSIVRMYFCSRIEQGLPPACAQQCVGRIRSSATWTTWKASAQAGGKWKVALPLPPSSAPAECVLRPPLSPSSYDAEGRLTGGGYRISLVDFARRACRRC